LASVPVLPVIVPIWFLILFSRAGVPVHAFLDDYAAHDDEQSLDSCLLGFWQLNLKFVQKRCEDVLLVFHPLQTSFPSLLSVLSSNQVVDILGAVEYLVEKGIANPERLSVGGWSYGGILTNATIATDTRFKAAASGTGVSMQLSFYGVDQHVLQDENELGLPWKGIDNFLKIGFPFLHADRIKTPTLFLGGDKDFNVPLLGSEQMYQALQNVGTPTQLIIYPGENHGIARPSFQRDRMQRYLDWYAKYLLKTPAVTPAAPSGGR